MYRTYDFGHNESIIDVGVQPLWVPTNVISELMERDRVLANQLTALGLEIRFHAFYKGSDVNFFLARGDLEVGVGGDMPALSATTESKVAVTALMQQGFSSIVARRHMLLSELVGKRVGYAFGSNAHFALLHALSSAGVGERDVVLVPLEVDEMPEALASGAVDAFSAWEPTPTIALTTYERTAVVHRSLSTGYLYFARSLADHRPGAVQSITASVIRAVNWSRRGNLITACRWAALAEQDLTGRPPVLSAEQVAILARDDILGGPRGVAIPASDLAPDGRLVRELEFLIDLGKIPATSTWHEVRSCFNPDFVADLQSHASELGLGVFDYMHPHD